MKRSCLLLLLLILVFSNKVVHAQPAWSKIYNLCPDAGVFASNAVVVYADDSFFIAAGLTYTPGVSNYHSYLAKINYKGEVLKKKYLYFPGHYNVINTGYCLTKMSNDKYLLAGMDWDFTTSSLGIGIKQPYYSCSMVNWTALTMQNILIPLWQENL